MNQPIISVITPVYNCEKYIARTIESVLGQDYPSLEYILLNDGSGDNSLDIMSKYEKDSRVRLFSHANMGEYQSDDKGIALARGKYFMIVNADDPLEELFAIPLLVGFMEENPEILVAYPNFTVIDQDGKPIQDIDTQEYSFVDMLRLHRCFPSAGTIYRRESLLRVGVHDYSLKYIADYDYFLRIALLGPFKHLPLYLATWRRHPAQLSNDKGRIMATQHIKLIDKFYSQDNLPEELLKVKDEAFAYANVVAGVVANNVLDKARYFAGALFYYPKIIVDVSPKVRRVIRFLKGGGF